MRARIIINPSSGRQILQRHADRLIAALLADGTLSDADTVRTTGAGDAYRAARYYQDWQFDLILVVGGDGTVNEVISGLLDGKHNTPLAIVPAGTVNDFAYAMGLPRSDVKKIGRMIHQGKIRLVDVGRANSRYFLNVAAAGLLTDVAYKVPSDAKTVLGNLAYLLEGARDLSQTMEPIRIRLVTPEQTFEEDCLLFIVANTTSVGGFRNFAPEASVSDGLLDVIIVLRQNFLELLPLLVQIANGDHVGHPKITYFQTPSLRVECLDGHPVSLDIDGERGDDLPVDISVLPKALRLIVP